MQPADRAMRQGDRLIAGALALTLAIAFEAIRGHADWGPSEGVYALSSRLFLDGGDLYGDLVASQPPWVYLFGAATLGIEDSLDALRLACGLLQVLTGLLAATAVWRLTGSRPAAVLAAPLVVATPWATHQHGLLLPEQLGAALLLGAALAASRPGTARAAGILAGLAVFTKLPFLLPAVAVVLVCPARATALRWALGTLGAQAAAFTIVFGTTFWSQIVEAQVQAGGGLDLQVGPWAQAAWNLGPLIVLAAAALVLRRRAGEPALLRTVGATAIATLALTATILKPGTGLNAVVPSEPLLVVLAIAGIVWAAGLPGPNRSRTALASSALMALLVAQSVSLLVDAENPRPFHRPLSSSPGWKVSHSRAEMALLVAAARACPPDAVYVGPPLAAFLADRRVPSDQPDFFIISRAEMHAATFARWRADSPRCG